MTSLISGRTPDFSARMTLPSGRVNVSDPVLFSTLTVMDCEVNVAASAASCLSLKSALTGFAITEMLGCFAWETPFRFEVTRSVCPLSPKTSMFFVRFPALI